MSSRLAFGDCISTDETCTSPVPMIRRNISLAWATVRLCKNNSLKSYMTRRITGASSSRVVFGGGGTNRLVKRP